MVDDIQMLVVKIDISRFLDLLVHHSYRMRENSYWIGMPMSLLSGQHQRYARSKYYCVNVCYADYGPTIRTFHVVLCEVSLGQFLTMETWDASVNRGHIHAASLLLLLFAQLSIASSHGTCSVIVQLWLNHKVAYYFPNPSKNRCVCRSESGLPLNFGLNWLCTSVC
jgi:hypothetical protein